MAINFHCLNLLSFYLVLDSHVDPKTRKYNVAQGCDFATLEIRCDSNFATIK